MGLRRPAGNLKDSLVLRENTAVVNRCFRREPGASAPELAPILKAFRPGILPFLDISEVYFSHAYDSNNPIDGQPYREATAPRETGKSSHNDNASSG
jgi:hypothetical protein